MMNLTAWHTTKKTAFLLLVAVFSIVNTRLLFKDIAAVKKERGTNNIYYFSGLRFTGLEEILKGERVLGYYTDKDLNNRINAGQFAQAQYALAPAILDINNTNHAFIIFDCSSQEKAFTKIREAGAVPFKRNQYGIILARKITR